MKVAPNKGSGKIMIKNNGCHGYTLLRHHNVQKMEKNL